MKLKSSVQITLIIVLGIIALFFIATSLIKSFSEIQSRDTIQVNGQSTIDVVPDLITIYYNIETQSKTSKEAEDANSAIVNDLIYRIVQLGYDEKDLKTENFNIYPEYDWTSGTQNLIGYKATHSLKIELSTDELNQIGDLIDAGANSGAGINYINFELSDELQQKYKSEAIKLAAQDAKIKAEAIAEGFDKKIGKLVSVSLSDFGYYPWIAYDFSASSGSIESAKEEAIKITPSEREVTAYVGAVYKLK